MEKQSYYFLLLLIALVICIGVFWFQFNNDVATFMIVNATEIEEGGSFKGALIDSYGQAVKNKTITYHKPGYQMGTLVTTQTDENGEFLLNICRMPLMKTGMVILHMPVMANIKDALMKRM